MMLAKSRPALSARLLLLASACALGVTAVAVAEPQLNVVAPWGILRGQEVEIDIRGRQLQEPQQLLFYSSGIEVQSLESKDASHVVARIAVAEDCPLGHHALRLCTGTGISNLRVLTVSALPIVAELEPNHPPDQSQPIPREATVMGTLTAEDLDSFAIFAEEGERISAEVEALRLGYAFSDLRLEIVGPDGAVLSEADDSRLTRQDPFAVVIAPRAGNFRISIRDALYRGGDDFRYLLHLGRFPRPVALSPGGGSPGEDVQFLWIQPGLDSWTSTISLPADEQRQHPLFAQDEQGIAPTPNWIRVNDLPHVAESEPNERVQEAQVICVPSAVEGVLQEDGDTDFFRFNARKGEVYQLRIVSRRVTRSVIDPVLVLRFANGRYISANDDAGTPDSALDLSVPEDGEYALEVRDYLRRGGAEFVYRIEIDRRAPDLSLSLPERVRLQSTTISVPRGNRMALMVAARKRFFDEPIQLRLDHLPEGMSQESPPIMQGRDRTPVLLTAAEEAPLAGALVPVTGTVQLDERELTGQLLQRTTLVRGRNNRDMWGYDAERFAVAVTDKVPYSISIAPPRVPLVRDGTMNLRVVAEKAEGFDEPITLKVLYNPPGLSSRRSVVIPKGKTEALIPMTANSKAQLSSSPIVVIGTANVGGVRREVATPFIELDVVDSFFALKFVNASVEQAGQAKVTVNVEHKRSFDGEAKVELIGLPAGTSAEPQTMTRDTPQLTFTVKAEPHARPGRYKTLLCRITVSENGEPITHILGRGQLRVDTPLTETASYGADT